MHILVLNRFALRLVPYRDYIDPAFDCTLITSSGGVSADPEQRARQLAGYASAVVLDDYANLARLEYTAHRLHAERNFDGIGRGEKARGADRFQPNARVRVGGEFLQ